MNEFGGNWTERKIEILVEYAKAYLSIMKIYAEKYNWKLLYFDGFAGPGEIIKIIDDKLSGIYDVNFTIGAARRIVEIEQPRSFDEYYFVEKNSKNVKELGKNTKEAFSNKKIHVVREDCNKKMIDLSAYLRNSKIKIIEHLHILTLAECKLNGVRLRL